MNRSNYKTLFLLWLSHLTLDFFTGIWPIYKTIAQIDLAVAGLIAGASGFIGEALQLFFGYFSDRGHRKKALMFGLALASSILWITLSSDIRFSFICLLLLMIGSGSFHPAAIGFTSTLSTHWKGRNILLFSSGGAIGLGISQLAFTGVLDLSGGHALILAIPVAILLILISFHKFPEQTLQTNRVPLREFFKPLLEMKKPLLLLYFAQIANYTVLTAVMFLLPDLLAAKGCHTWLCLGGGHLSFVLGGALMMPIAGYLSDRLGHKRVMLMITASAATLLYLFLHSPTLPLGETILFLWFLGGFMWTINPMIVAWGNRLVPSNPSTVSALLMGFAWCVANLGATWAGLIASYHPHNPIPLSLSYLGLLFTAVFVLILFLPEPENIPEQTQ